MFTERSTNDRRLRDSRDRFTSRSPHRLLVTVVLCYSWPVAAEPLEFGEQLPQMLLSLGLVLIAILGLAWVSRRFLSLRPRVANGDLQIVAALSVGPRERIAVLQVGDQQVLVGLCPGKIEALHVFDSPAITVESQASPSFASALRSTARERFAGSRK